MPTQRELLEIVHRIVRDADDAPPLARIARASGWSEFHVHRGLRALLGEPAIRFARRLRLERAAARLATTDTSVTRVSMAHGFASPEVFTRAFQRAFKQSPSDYQRNIAGAWTTQGRREHTALVDSVGPCVGLYRMSLLPSPPPVMPPLSIETRTLAGQPALIVRRRVAREQIAATIGATLPIIFQLAIARGVAIVGRPFTRYTDFGPGLLTMETGVPIASEIAGEGEVTCVTLPAGKAAVAMHGGSYDDLQSTYASLEQWIADAKLTPAGAPWESYVTDPGEHPDPATWRTEVFWPVT